MEGRVESRASEASRRRRERASRSCPSWAMARSIRACAGSVEVSAAESGGRDHGRTAPRGTAAMQTTAAMETHK